MLSIELPPRNRPKRRVLRRLAASVKKAWEYRRRSATDVVDEAERARQDAEAKMWSDLDPRNYQQL